MSTDPIIINQGLNSKTSKSGKQSFHIEVKSEALAFDHDTKRLVKPLAEALAHHYREKIRAIAATASPATIKAREVARRAFERGEAWATKRYAGGRMGARTPGQSDRLFNDSGRFAESIIAQPASDGTFRVNVAANRLSPDTLNGGVAALQRIWARLVELVPEIQDVQRVMQTNEMLRAQTRAVQGMVVKLKQSSATTGMDVARAAFGAARQALGLVDTILAA